ncbi:MAG: hypothetical protein KA366_02665 [Hydromonas sp.]|nr:hypothetical protein [Hydromonas sp.]
MLKKVILLLNQRPDLVADYVSAYATLLRETVLKARRRYARRAVWLLMTVILGNASVIVGALAMMLWINMPELNVLKVFLIPSVLVILTVIAGLLVVYDTDSQGELRQLNHQLHQDSKVLALLRETHEQI